MSIFKQPAPASLFDWNAWNGGPCPVPAAERVEVQQDERTARGVACAFNWRSTGPDQVRFWRFERPAEKIRELLR